MPGGDTYYPTYNENKQAYQAAQDQQQLHDSLSNVLFPAQVASSMFGLAQEQLHLQSQAQRLAQQTKDMADQNESERAAADQTDRLTNSNGADSSLPTGESAVAQKGRLSAIMNWQQGQAQNALITVDHINRVNQAKEDAMAMGDLGVTADQWSALDDHSKNQARFDIQFQPLRGKGLTDSDISALPLNGKTVGDLLGDPTNFTPRGTLKPSVFGDVVTAATQAQEQRKTELQAEAQSKVYEAKKETPSAVQHQKDVEQQKATEAELKMRETFGKTGLSKIEKDTMSGPEIEQRYQEWKAKLTGGAAPAPAAGSVADQLTAGATTPAPAAGPKEIASKADYDALPSGAVFLHGGKQYRKQ